MSAIDISRRMLLASGLALPAICPTYAADITGPLTPRQRQQLVFARRRDAAQAG